MTEERPTTTDEQVSPGGEPPATNELRQELQSLGRQLGNAFRALWESEESRQVRQELKEAFAEFGQELDQAVKSAQESDAAKEFSSQVKETVDRARESEIAENFLALSSDGLKKLNQELSKLVASLEKPDADEAGPEAETEA
jgi:hypothetical protein